MVDKLVTEYSGHTIYINMAYGRIAEVYTVHKAAEFKNDSSPTDMASVVEAIAHQHTFICNEQMTRTNISGF